LQSTFDQNIEDEIISTFDWISGSRMLGCNPPKAFLVFQTKRHEVPKNINVWKFYFEEVVCVKRSSRQVNGLLGRYPLE